MPCGVCQEAREAEKVVTENIGKAMEEKAEELENALEEAQKKAAEEGIVVPK